MQAFGESRSANRFPPSFGRREANHISCLRFCPIRDLIPAKPKGSAICRSERAEQKSSNRVLSPRLSFETSPLANRSKGFLIVAHRFTSSRERLLCTGRDSTGARSQTISVKGHRLLVNSDRLKLICVLRSNIARAHPTVSSRNRLLSAGIDFFESQIPCVGGWHSNKLRWSPDGNAKTPQDAPACQTRAMKEKSVLRSGVGYRSAETRFYQVDLREFRGFAVERGVQLRRVLISSSLRRTMKPAR